MHIILVATVMCYVKRLCNQITATHHHCLSEQSALCPCQIPEVYTPLLERLIVVQIDSFPQYSERMQTTCCRSILKVLVAVASKGPVLWSFISSVGKSMIRALYSVQQCLG